MFVSEGNLYKDTTWQQTADEPITLGTTPLTWAPFGAPAAPVPIGAWKEPVRVASTAAVVTSGLGTPVDGVTLAAGDRVLLKNQTSAWGNGIYVAAAGAWTRATDNDSSAEQVGAAVIVREGTTQANTLWQQTVDPPIIVGTTNLSWVQFGVTTAYLGGAGLTLTGSTFDVGQGYGLTNAADTVGIDQSVVTTHQYLDIYLTGLTWKQPVRAATTGNHSLTGTAAVDGVAIVAGDRVLVRAQTNPVDNGIYQVAAGTWTRTLDADTGVEVIGATVFVSMGTTLGNTTWQQTADPPLTVGTTAQTWTQFGAGGSGGSGAAEVDVSTGGPAPRVGQLLWVDTDATLPAPVSTGWQALALTSPWTNYGGGGWAPAGIRRIGDVVELRGLVTNNGAIAPSTIATVPAPLANLILLGAGDSTSATAGTTWAVDIRVYTDGRMQIQSPISSFVSLSQVRYSVA